MLNAVQVDQIAGVQEMSLIGAPQAIPTPMNEAVVFWPQSMSLGVVEWYWTVRDNEKMLYMEKIEVTVETSHSIKQVLQIK